MNTIDTPLFNKEHSKCDMCVWEGKTTAMGPHVIKHHLKDIDKRILSFIDQHGITVETMVKETGFSAERVRGRFKALAHRGRIGLVQGQYYVAYTPDAPVEFDSVRVGTARCSSCKKVRLTTFFAFDRFNNALKTECKACTFSKVDRVKGKSKIVEKTKTKTVPVKKTNNDMLDSLMGQVYRKADELLRQKYKNEYDELVNERVQNMLNNLVQFAAK